MAYGLPGLSFADSPAIDAFGRLRCGSPTLLIDCKQVGTTPEITTSTAVSGSGAATYNVTRSSTYLTVGPASGVATRQTKVRAIYQPGKSMLAFITFIMAPAQTGLIQQVGLNDSSDGILLQLSDAVLSVVRRSSVSGAPVDVAVPQASWNLDKLDGSGPSGITLDITKPQILCMDLEWLGVGRVRVGFVIDGLFRYVHEFRGANGVDGLTSVYIKNPNLPVRWHVNATGAVTGTPQLESICGSVSSEGGYDVIGNFAAADRGNTGRSIANGVWAEILAVRIQAAFTSYATAFIQQLSVVSDVSKNAAGCALYRLILNPASASGGAWTAVTNSIMEQNTTRTGATGLPNASAPAGIVLDTGYVGTGPAADFSRPAVSLGVDLAGVADVYSLQVQNITLGTTNFYGGMTWREVT
jgi:hypothetical protein